MPLGEYTFVRAAGKGSYGEVSIVRHRRDNKQYVIKKLNLKHASSRERKAAEQEAQLLSQLKHPNIVTYRESWEGEDGLLYIVMGFCEGGDLYHKLKEQKGTLLPENQVVEWFVQIAMALQYLHEKHILHRDLKTQNVFLTRSNIIKVGDLGIARVLENQYDMASTLIGTPYYMSPELFSNKPYNYKSDVWALGCCVYEMATLKHAFNAKDMNSLVYRIIEGKLPPMPKDYSIQLKELIRTMLSKKPEERPSVRSILRQPYIKHQISLFLEATKAKTSKNHKKMSDLKPQSSAVTSGNAEMKNGNIISQKHPGEHLRKSNGNEEKCLINNKTYEVSPSGKLATESEKSINNNILNSTDVSIATMSKVDIVLVPLEKGKSKNEKLVENNKNRYSSIPSETEFETAINGPPFKEEKSQKVTTLYSRTEKVDFKKTFVDEVDDSNDTMKLLQPISEAQNTSDQNLDSTEKLLAPYIPVVILDRAFYENPAESNGKIQNESAHYLQPQGSEHEPSLSRQRRHKKKQQLVGSSEKAVVHIPQTLPSLPDVNVKTRNYSAGKQSAVIAKPISRSNSIEVASSKDRPLSARERRRLKQSQEDMLPSGPVKRRASHSAVTETKVVEDDGIQTAQSSSEPSIYKKKSLIGCFCEDELSTSSSSTEKSDGDCKEGKTNEMNDLVQLMTQTLKMDNKENCEQSAVPVPESQFMLNRKYRDTLILHGKASEEPDTFQFQEFSSDILSGPEKIRRLIEILRADVVQGLGVKLLEKVYDVMEEDDEQKREDSYFKTFFYKLECHQGSSFTVFLKDFSTAACIPSELLLKISLLKNVWEFELTGEIK
ncbi:serine/threonine-protein kinase Nek4 isoform X2 [Eublepharis macularius]|uniref:Serine/threonine-protein kinase Nek4 n=1 Tax=Eublepharis macularius TaxID=481883 RepID=A0AA97J8B7_EUBMA|nr:serine/threonine-protein kinase Nek4 isoform X2 [Eublepharis macularius]